MYDYANILFTGKCNLRCYECIGKNQSLEGLPRNTDLFPLKNIDELINKVNQYNIKDLAFTGSNVDPQLYLYEEKLINYIRERLRVKSNLSLHTNGLLALQKIKIFNQYDKASISLPSFNIETYEKVTLSKRMPDIKGILRESNIPIKLSMLITPFNVNEIEEYISKAREVDVKRIVIRKLKGRDKEFPIEKMHPFTGKEKRGEIFGWPIYDFGGIEVTICGFDNSNAKGLFLFSDGRLEDRLV
jgi:molybdenum cofactor biosynthesis enzyme MoaA